MLKRMGGGGGGAGGVKTSFGVVLIWVLEVLAMLKGWVRIALPCMEGAGGRAHKGLDQRCCYLPSLKLMTGPLVHQKTVTRS